MVSIRSQRNESVDFHRDPTFSVYLISVPVSIQQRRRMY